MRWLVTAFAPFAQSDSNSSMIVAERLFLHDWKGHVEFRMSLPVTFAGAYEALGNTAKYDGVLSLGQAEGRSKISLERVALNFADARIKDNAGARPLEQKVSTHGKDMHWCPIPWADFKRPDNCELSYSAGTFVCNTLFYQLLEAERYAGFVHIPLLKSQTGYGEALPRISDDDAVESLKQVLEFLVRL